MALKFSEYIAQYDIDYSVMGQLNESHEYANYVCSVMDKLTFYTKRNYHLMNSSLNESVKRIYNQDIKFNHNERIAAGCIFNEMLKKYEENYKKEISLCENIINNGYLLEEGVEYDYDTLTNFYNIEEGLGDWLKKKFTKGKDVVANTSKKIIDGAKDLTVKSVKVVKTTSNNLVDWAKQAKKDFTEKYETLKKLVNKIVKDGVNSVSDFIDHILEVFTNIGDNLCEVVKKLGGLKKENGEKDNIIDSVNDLKNVKDDNEKLFISKIVERAEAMISKDEKNVKKLMAESYEPYMIDESIVDNKFIAWLSGYKSNGEKMSWWKSLLISICASLIVYLLPKVMIISGLGASATVCLTALVGVIWGFIGFLKLIFRRNKERKPGEPWMTWKTGIFMSLCLLSTAFSAVTFCKNVVPFLQELCNTMGWTGGDDMSAFGKFIYDLTKKISPKDCFTEGGLVEVSEKIKNFGGDFRGNDIIQSNTDAINAMKDMPGASTENVNAYNDFLTAMQNAKGSSGVLKAAQEFANNPDLPTTFMLDTSKWGGSGPIKQAIEELSANGTIPDSTILTTGGSLATQKASKGVYGFCSFLTGLTKDQANDVFQRAAEIAGVDANTIHMHAFGLGNISDVLTHTETVQGIFDVIAPNLPTLPVIIPFFDKKKWGKYKLRFASNTRGELSYPVVSVEMLPADKIEESSPAFDTLKKLHNDSWKDYQENENKKNKDKKKKEKVEEPQYIVFNVKNSDDDDSKYVGVVFDTLTMMVADVAGFNSLVKRRRRTRPYFMKGLLSRLSFRPVESNDNETKNYIRATLGQTMKTLIMQNVLYGEGRKYIDSKIDGKKAEYKLRETILDTDTKINSDETVFELGNFSPNEMLKCLTDDSKTNKISYDFLDGQYGSKIFIKIDNDGNIVSKKSRTDSQTIENVKYYLVSNDIYKTSMENYEEKKKKYKEGEIGKRPVKPDFIKGDDGRWYKKASKEFLNDKKNERKKLYDFIDLKIIPVLAKGELYKKLIEDKNIKKLLYKEDDDNNVKLNKEVITVLRPFLYRPEKTFATDDEYKLADILKEQGVEGNKLGWFKKMFKDEEQLHDTFKKAIEQIWDYLEKDIERYKDKRTKKTNENYESIFDMLVEEYIGESMDDDENYEYDLIALNEKNSFILSRDEFISRYGY